MYRKREKVYSKGEKTAQRRVDLDHLHGRSAPGPLHQAEIYLRNIFKRLFPRNSTGRRCLELVELFLSEFKDIFEEN